MLSTLMLALAIGTSYIPRPHFNPIEKQNRELRTNKVWSIRLDISTCGLEIREAFVTKIDKEGNVSSWDRISYVGTTLQWNINLEDNLTTNYSIADLFAEYSQTRYMVRYHGKVIASGNPFYKTFWISPAGISSKQIDKAPIRQDTSAPWTEDEQLEFTFWYVEQHEWLHTNLFREFKALYMNADARIIFPIQLATEDCKEAE